MRRLPSIILVAVWLATYSAGSHAGHECATCGGGCPAKASAAKVETLGPCDMPCRLEGVWKITLCFETKCSHMGHTWLRYENVATGEVHTVGRYRKGHGGAKGVESGEYIYEPAPVSGVIYDQDLRREKQIRAGEIAMISTTAVNPILFKGLNNGFQHGGHKNNCVTHCRDGWYHFTGEWYDLPCLAHTSNAFLDEVAARHPEILCGH